MIRHRTLALRGINLFYREAGSPHNPALLLLHGFPSSSFMFRNLMRDLADRYYLIAPDYPGFGHSDAPDPGRFAYTFENLARLIGELVDHLPIDKLSLYVFDYGAPVGFRYLVQEPQRLQCLIVQNGNIYAEGVGPILRETKANLDAGTPEALRKVMDQFELPYTMFEYLHGATDASLIAPDGYTLDQARMDRPGNKAIQFQLKSDYRTNFPLYTQWQAFLRRVQPPTLVVWGENDPIFTKAGALAYQRDLTDVESHFYATGHFALEEYGETIAATIRDFLARKLR
ncbi:MAG: alpha/beta hydrolase [Ferruginibacter sp.]|nr:alpha/beta hydrolase [Cytophagales bacterium]